MLKTLKLKNIALISSLDIEFSEGLNILSGETGAGKSIIVDGLMLLTGGKFDKTLLRYGADGCFVEGVFDTDDKINAVLVDLGLDVDDILIISRKFSSDGKGEARINGRVVTLSMLKAVSAHLIDICGQNEHQILSNPTNHMQILDYYARHNTENLKAELSVLYTEYKQIIKSINEIGDESSRERSIDIYRYQLNEIESANVLKGEEDELISLKKKYTSSEKLTAALNSAKGYLSDFSDGLSALELIEDSLSEVKTISSFSEDYEDWYNRLSAVSIEIEDISDSIKSELRNFDFSIEDLEETEKRLEIVKNIHRKYGDYDKMVALKSELLQKLDLLENSADNYEKLLKKKKAVIANIYKVSQKISDHRRSASKELQTLVEKELSELGMPDSIFEVNFSDFPELDSCENFISANGMDKIEFYLTPNAGQPLKPLVKIISGGELSRLMLALKVVSGNVDGIPVLIFDEIDTGISGKVGQEIAKKLARLSKTHQLLCVTHLPQIAAMADNHYFISKSVTDGQTYTDIRMLSSSGMIDEIARLTGSKDISDLGTQTALQMKEWSDNYKKSV